MGDLVQYLQEFRKTTEVYLSVIINGVFLSIAIALIYTRSPSLDTDDDSTLSDDVTCEV